MTDNTEPLSEYARAVIEINERRKIEGVALLSERELTVVEQMADDPWGHIYDPRPVISPTPSGEENPYVGM